MQSRAAYLCKHHYKKYIDRSYNKLMIEYDTMSDWEKEDYISKLYFDYGSMSVSEIKFAQFLIEEEGKKRPPYLRVFNPVI